MNRLRNRRRRAAAAAVAIAAIMLAATHARAADAQPDPYFASGDQWALSGAPASIGAPAAWCVSTGAGVTVAVVDSGADFTHPNLRGKLLAGAQFTGEVPPNGPPSAGPGDIAAVTDLEGHGTMVAGVIGADTGNGIGMAGVAPDARILVVKVLDNDSGTASDADIANGIRWAADHGAQVINVSLGPGDNLDDTVDSAVPPAVEYAGSRNVNVTISAGNAVFPLFNTYGPGSGALVVGALARDGSLASYSNTGAGVTVYAPGGDSKGGGLATGGIVTTAVGGLYGRDDGTSFAAPMVAGVLALLRATGYSAAEARARILSTAVMRHGLPELDAAAALGAHGTCPMPRTAVAVSPQSTAPPGTGGAALTTPPVAVARSGGAPATTPAGGSGHALLVAALSGAAVAGGAGWMGFVASRRERRRKGVLATMRRAAAIGRASDGDDRRP